MLHEESYEKLCALAKKYKEVKDEISDLIYDLEDLAKDAANILDKHDDWKTRLESEYESEYDEVLDIWLTWEDTDEGCNVSIEHERIETIADQINELKDAIENADLDTGIIDSTFVDLEIPEE